MPVECIIFNSVFTHYGSRKTNPTTFISAQRLSERTVYVTISDHKSKVRTDPLT
jgi:hypothetical protein